MKNKKLEIFLYDVSAVFIKYFSVSIRNTSKVNFRRYLTILKRVTFLQYQIDDTKIGF